MYYVFVNPHYHVGSAVCEENVRVMQNEHAYTASISRGPSKWVSRIESRKN
jgi:hypothetical protein